MADFRVTFVGSLGNLAQFNSAIRSSFAANASALRQANQSIVSRAIGRPVQGIDIPLQQTRTAGVYLQNMQTKFDHFNNSIVQSGQLVERYEAGYQQVLNRLTGRIEVKPIFDEAYNSNFQRATTNMQEYLRVTAQLGPIESQLLGIRKTGATRQAEVTNRIAPYRSLIGPTADLLGTKESDTGAWTQISKRNTKYYENLFGSLKNANLLHRIPIYDTPDSEGIRKLTPGFLDPATATVADLRRTIVNSGGEIKDVFGRIGSQITNVSGLIGSSITRSVDATAARLRAVENSPLTRSLRQYQQNLFNVPEGIDAQSYRVLENNKVVRDDLIKRGGLGGGAPYGTQQFFGAAKTSEFEITDVSKDISQGLTRVTGQMRDANGVLNTFSYNIDKNGKVVDSWGRKLYSAGGFLNETASRIIRFSEFMVGATLVLGAFSVALSSVGKINELNSSLQRFAITARLNDSELGEMFSNLSQVAQATATPLVELVKAADDMALATRRANQSSDEWKTSILELATAVGIFTNITGEDTTKATEQLVAIMQQLSLSTKELVPLLSQITAAAGGQAGSITDIAEALSSLAEAASEAGLTVTQQIAATQVISLATGKTASETAVAFKALFGAINSDAAVNKLEEFNIAVRDTEGNLRPFLEIYSDIADAVNRGIIPQGRVNEVLRAIGGGPRRAPDAAALLANVGKVFEVERIAAGATNDALIANAQILTTNQAKITQFQSAWDESLYLKLNKTLEDLVAILAQLGTAFADVFGSIPQGLISFTTQLIAFYAAFSLLGKISGTIGLTKLFESMSRGFKGVADSAKVATTGITGVTTAIASADTKQAIYRTAGPDGVLNRPQYLSGGKFVSNADYKNYLNKLAVQQSQDTSAPFRLDKAGSLQYAKGGYVSSAVAEQARSAAEKGIIVAHETGSKTFVSRLKDFFKSPQTAQAAVGIIGSAVLGGGSSLLAGGSPVQAAAQAAQFASFGAFMTGNPIGIAAGVGLGGVGLVLSHIAEEEEKVITKTKELQLSLYNLTQEWKINQAGVDSAQDTYDDIQSSLTKATKGSDEYRDLQTKLGAATVGLSTSINTQRASLEKMLDVLTQLRDYQGDKGGPNWKGFIDEIVSQNLSPELLQQLRGELAEAIYAAAGQVYSSKVPLGFDPSALNYSQSNTNPLIFGPEKLGSSNLAFGLPVSGQRQISASDLLNDTNLVKEILTDASNNRNAPNPYSTSTLQFPFENSEAVSAFRAGMATLLEAGAIQQEAVDRFEAAVFQFQNATLTTAQTIKGYQASIETDNALGQLTPEQYNNAQLRVQIATALQEQLTDTIANIGRVGPDDRDEAKSAAQAIATQIKALLVNSQGGTNIAQFGREELRNYAINEISQQPGWNDIKNDVDAVNGAIREQLEAWGADQKVIDYVAASISNLSTVAIAEIKAMKDATEEWGEGQLAKIGQDLLTLQARLQGGEFKNEKGKTDLTEHNFLKSQYEAEARGINQIVEASKALEDVLGTENAVSDATAKMSTELTAAGINGFQGMTGSIDNANVAFFRWIDTLNLSGKAVDDAVRKWIGFIRVITQLMYIQQNIDAATANPPAPVFRRNRSGEGGTGTTTVNLVDIYKANQATLEAQLDAIFGDFKRIGQSGTGTFTPGTGSTSTKTGPKPTVDTLYLSEEQAKLADPLSLVKQAYQDALKLQSQIPGETKKNRLNTVVVFDELQKIFSARGVSEELLRRALDNLTSEMEKANQKADTIRRIRVGAGDFSAIANVPVNSATGVSVGANNQINITFNLNGTNLTPAQFTIFANMIGAEIARRV